MYEASVQKWHLQLKEASLKSIQSQFNEGAAWCVGGATRL